MKTALTVIFAKAGCVLLYYGQTWTGWTLIALALIIMTVSTAGKYLLEEGFPAITVEIEPNVPSTEHRSDD